LLNKNKGKIQRAEDVADKIGAVQDHAHEAALSWLPTLKLHVIKACMNGRRAPYKAKIVNQKTPPFKIQHWSSIRYFWLPDSKENKFVVANRYGYTESCFD
jgi:hypothetical protein